MEGLFFFVDKITVNQLVAIKLVRTGLARLKW